MLDKHLLDLMFDWLIEVKYWLGYLTAKNNTIYTRDDDLEIYWYVHYGRIKVSIKAKKEFDTGKNLDYLMYALGRDYFEFSLPKNAIIKDSYQDIEAEIRRYFPRIKNANTWAICELGESENCLKRYGYFDICQRVNKQMICSKCIEKQEKEKEKYPGYIYLIGNQAEGIYKIGLSHKPKERYKAFKTKLPFEVKIIHQIGVDNMEKAEKKLHVHFQNKRTNGEWFNLTEQDVEFILKIKEFLDSKFLNEKQEQVIL